jgi:hypothetical protein
MTRPKRPTTAPLTDTERASLDRLLRHAARHAEPTVGGPLLRLWEHDQADRAQERRSAGGAARGAIRLDQQLKDTTARAEQAEAERDGAYRERAHLTAWLATIHPAVITPASDIDDDGWQILYLTAGGRQLSWHIAPGDADLFAHVEHVDHGDERGRWDGHTTEQKYQAIRSMTFDQLRGNTDATRRAEDLTRIAEARAEDWRQAHRRQVGLIAAAEGRAEQAEARIAAVRRVADQMVASRSIANMAGLFAQRLRTALDGPADTPTAVTLSVERNGQWQPVPGVTSVSITHGRVTVGTGPDAYTVHLGPVHVGPDRTITVEQNLARHLVADPDRISWALVRDEDQIRAQVAALFAGRNPRG